MKKIQIQIIQIITNEDLKLDLTLEEFKWLGFYRNLFHLCIPQ